MASNLGNLDAVFASSPDLSANLVAYVESILSDSIPVLQSRSLLSAFVERFKALPDNEVKTGAAPQILNLLSQKSVAFEQQDTDFKFAVADAYEAEEDFASSATTLQTITLDSAQGRTVTDTEKASVWMRICRCYLEEDDPTSGLAWLNKVKGVIHNVTDQTIRLQFQLSQARINDSQRNFLDASTAYHALSNEPAIDEEERLRALSAAITTAVLAPAGPTRARQLGRLYKDERASETPEYSILEKIFLDRLLSPTEVAAFAANLQEHQLAKTSDGSTVLDKAILEHNLVATSRLYQNIPIASLGTLLGVTPARAEEYAANMIESKRLMANIDQITEMVQFKQEERGESANIAHLSEEVEKVTTMLTREYPVFSEGVLAA